MSVHRLPKTAKRIAELRTQAGLTQKELADAIGLSHSVISYAERGGAPSANLAHRLATFFEVEVNEFWEPNTPIAPASGKQS